MQLQWDFLGRISYAQAWEWQKQLRERRIRLEIPDTMLLLEHPTTITLGRHRGKDSLLASPETLALRQIEVIHSDRGGDATLHTPGQLVGYIIFHLTQLKLSIPDLVEQMANAICSILQQYGISAHYDKSYPGVWVNNRKIAAFGLNLKQDVTMHGFALNLDPDLSLFDLLIPCGLVQRGVTSLQQPLTYPAPKCADIAVDIAQAIALRLSLVAQRLQPLSHATVDCNFVAP